ncbi:MAG: hypothetical protein AB7D39_17660 [Pseudodesulfovibrio sp.]|uniref:hypothetical protein n=1 Tax=Pseudodesulfovibrio sp. TaxID=2035812 RepID=UPI003D108DE5
MSKKTTDLIARRHPDYDAMAPKWAYYASAYFGDDDVFILENLIRFFREDDASYRDRIKRAWRDNHTRAVINLLFGFLGQTRPTVVGDMPAAFEAFSKRATRTGESLFRHMLDIGVNAAVYGRCYVVVDRPAKTDGPWTNLDNVSEIYAPYSYVVTPEDVLDISFGPDGNVRWCLIMERERDDADPFSSSGDVTERYRLWTAESWTVYNSDGKITASGVNSAGVVPVIPVTHEQMLSPYKGRSMIAGVVNKDKSIMNDWSDLEASITAACFPLLKMPTGDAQMATLLETNPDLVSEARELRKRVVELFRSGVLSYDPGNTGSTGPEYLSWDTSQITPIVEMIKDKISGLYAAFALEGEVGVEVSSESGVAKEHRFNKLNRQLASIADNLEETQDKIVSLWGLYTDTDVSGFSHDWPDRFDVASLSDELDDTERLALSVTTPAFLKTLQKALVAKWAAQAKIPADVVDAINREIDEQSFDEADLFGSGTADTAPEE